MFALSDREALETDQSPEAAQLRSRVFEKDPSASRSDLLIKKDRLPPLAPVKLIERDWNPEPVLPASLRSAILPVRISFPDSPLVISNLPSASWDGLTREMVGGVESGLLLATVKARAERSRPVFVLKLAAELGSEGL